MTQQETFDTVGSHTWDVPQGAVEVTATLEGAEGGAEHENFPFTDPADGAEGGITSGTIPVTPGETLHLYVGGQGDDGHDGGDGGFNGGGDAEQGDDPEYHGGGGGGATDVRQGGDTLSDRVLVAGGGGGAGSYGSTAGAGGGLQGGDGEDNGGDGGTQNAGGAGGEDSADGEDGSLGSGGDGGASTGSGGGGGAGYYGGGGGAGRGDIAEGGGGGGGSGYVDDSVSDGSTSQGGSTDDGEIVLEYEIDLEVDDLAVTAERDTELDLEWTPATGGDGQRLYRDTSAGVDPNTATLVEDLDPDVDTYTDSVDNGTTHYYVLETYQDGEEELSNEADGTTTLPDVDSFTLDASTQNELTVAPEDILNAGQYRIRWKRSTVTTYPSANETTLAFDADPLLYTITDVLDGEQYDVGVRSETDDVTGTWHTAEEVTKLVAASGLAFPSVSQTSLSLSWADESDFDGSYQVWRDRADYAFDDPKGELVATLGDETETFDEADELHPEREYTYTLRALTQYVHADASATVETASAGLEQSAVPTRGAYAEVDIPVGGGNPETGTKTIAPRILDDIEARPTLNGKPRMTIPVPRDEMWASERFDDAEIAVRAWDDGQRLPIDTLEDVELQPDRAVLHVSGGRQLDRRVRRDVDTEESHQLVEELVEQETGYVADVDPPAVEAEQDVMQTAATTAALESIRDAVADPTDPVHISDGELQLADTNAIGDAGGSLTAVGGSIGGADSNDDMSGGAGRVFSSLGDLAGLQEFDVEYTIPEDAIDFAVRLEGESNGAEVDAILYDQDADEEVGRVTIWGSAASSGLIWWNKDGEPDNVLEESSIGEWTDGDIPPGTYTLQLECTTSGADVFIDLLSMRDERYQYSFDDTVHEPGGYLDGPETKPDAVPVRFDVVESILSVIEGTVDVEMDDISEGQALGLRNDTGDDFDRGPNTETHTVDFAAPGSIIQAEVTLSRYDDGAQEATPRFGYLGQSIDSITVSAVLDDTPLVINQSFDGDLADVLTEIADAANSVWELRYDHAEDAFAVEYTQPGQRESDARPDAVDYSARKISQNIQKAIVKGATLEVREESWTADVGEAVALDNGEIVASTDRVVDDQGTVYERGSDYTLDRGEGTITALAGGDLVDNEAYLIDYRYRVTNSFETGEFSGAPEEEFVETISELTTEQACGLAAKLIVDEGSDPRWEVDVSLPPSIPADLQLIEALNVGPETQTAGGFGVEFGVWFGEEADLVGSDGIIPTSDPLAIYELSDSPDGLELRLGDRDRVRDVVDSIQSRVQALSRRT